MTGDQTPPAGWYPDEGVDAPAGQQRYWDGSAWTEHTTAPAGPSYQAAVQQAPRNGLGIAALILGIIGVVIGIIPFFFWIAGILGVIGLILGFVGRGRAKRGEATNGTMALWGIITSAVAMVVSIVGLLILIAWADLSVEFWAGPEDTASPTAENTVTPPGEAPTQAQETAAPGAGEVAFYDLEVGDCIADLMATLGERFFTVETVPCSQPHSEEIYAVVPLPEGDFPGDEAVAARPTRREMRSSRASSGCRIRNRCSITTICTRTTSRLGTASSARSFARSTTRPVTRPERLPTPTADTPDTRALK